MTAVQALAQVFGRLGTLAGIYGVELGPMVQRLGELALLSAELPRLAPARAPPEPAQAELDLGC